MITQDKQKHNYNKDAEFGDLSEYKYKKFLEYYNELNNRSKVIYRLGYTTTIKETIEDLKEILNKEIKTDINIQEKIINKLNNNYNNLIEFYINNKEIQKRFKEVDGIDIFESLKKKLKIKDNKVQEQTRLQTLGVDCIEVNLLTNKVKFIEVKAFTVVKKMYLKLGIEYWSNYNNKTIGFTFGMLCDEVVYAQDIHKDITPKNKNKSLIKINSGRKDGSFDVTTVYNMFHYLEYLKTSVNEVLTYNNKFIPFIKSKTGGTISNFLLIDYKYFNKVKGTIEFYTTKDKTEMTYIN